MEGKVKWFSKVKGFGFVVDPAGKDHFVGVSNIKGPDLLDNGDIVTFDSTLGERGPRALNVKILIKSTNRLIDERISCQNCGKKIIPRIITGPPLVHGSYGWTPVPKRSICIFCGNTVREFPPSLWEKMGSVIFIIVFVLFFVIIVYKINSAHQRIKQNMIFPSTNITDLLRR